MSFEKYLGIISGIIFVWLFFLTCGWMHSEDNYTCIKKSMNVNIKIGDITYIIPRDGNTYTFYPTKIVKSEDK